MRYYSNYMNESLSFQIWILCRKILNNVIANADWIINRLKLQRFMHPIDYYNVELHSNFSILFSFKAITHNFLNFQFLEVNYYLIII